MSIYWRNMPILHNSAAEGFDTICMCLLEAEVYWTTQTMLLFSNLILCVSFCEILANYVHVFVLLLFLKSSILWSVPSVSLCVFLSIWTSASWLIAWDTNSALYFAHSVYIRHSNWLLCVDYTKVSDYRYDLDFKGQGQIHLGFCSLFLRRC